MSVTGIFSNVAKKDNGISLASARGTIADKLGIDDEILDVTDYKNGAIGSNDYFVARAKMLNDLKTSVVDLEKVLMDAASSDGAIKDALKDLGTGGSIDAAKFKKLPLKRKLALAQDLITRYHDNQVRVFEAQYSDAYKKGAKEFRAVQLKQAVKEKKIPSV